jgi:2,4-dienoyl-CoA reductase-like NADH-dependent reductase (Old Yellow Enzyme family)
MPSLFDPFTLRGVTLPHRIAIAPMCTYHAGPDGRATDWHFVHYGRFALGGAAMVMTESVVVAPEGRGCDANLGLWDDAQIAPLRRIADFLKAHGSVSAIQLHHAGRKADSGRPWLGPQAAADADERARCELPWSRLAPSALPYADSAPTPRAMTAADIGATIDAWAAAARRALAVGFEVLEIHAAHGYLINQFLSPIANHRSDGYGGSRAARMRFALDIVDAVRAVWPAELPLLVRVSAVDAAEGGWDLDDTVALARALKSRGVDAIDCSSGGIGGPVVQTAVPRVAGFQVPFAERVRREAGIPTIAVGLITQAEHAAEIIEQGQADLVMIGREALIDPNWPSAARTRLQPEGGHAHWTEPLGWWLDRRVQSIAVRGTPASASASKEIS